MNNHSESTERETLLVFNCHEAWVYQLGVLGYNLDIIVGLKGQYKTGWDEQMRPRPVNSRMLTLGQALDSKTNYYCIIAHNIADLLEIKSRNEARLLVIHSTMEGRILEEKSTVPAKEMKEMLHKYLNLIGGHAMTVSELKGKSWGFAEDIVPFCADSEDYPPFTGERECGLRICNFVSSRKDILLWDLHEKAFGGLHVKIVGHNPNMAGVCAAKDWEDLKKTLASHRFYIHLADPELEDGYNMATVEAMAAGMPILSNQHPSSPIEHGVSGFLSDEADELRKYARMLLEDKELAVQMGKEAQKVAAERFSKSQFKQRFLCSIEMARGKLSDKR